MIAMILIAIFTAAAFNQDAPVCTRDSAQTIQKEGIGNRK